jgi:delta8-fatty-acid desaturase
LDWFHGSLQFQLEEHLFPRVPRWQFRKLCAWTNQIFAKYDVPVVRIPFVEANIMVLRHMAKVGAKVAKIKSVLQSALVPKITDI